MTTPIAEDPELLRLYDYKNALLGALSELALTRATSVSLNGRAITRQSSAELRRELALTNQDIQNRLGVLSGNSAPYMQTITFQPGID